MKLILKGGLLILLLIFAQASFSQESPRDTTDTPVDSMQTEEVNVVDIIIQRGLMMGAASPNTSIKNTSGTWFVGLGFKIPVVKNKGGFRLTPGLAFTKLNYDSVDYATVLEFPGLADGVNYNFQKHRLTYFQVPLGAYVNFTTDEKGRPQIFGELGGYIGYNIGGVLRYGQNSDSIPDQQIRTKITNIADRERLQYGLYGRVGYKHVAINAQFRFPKLFTTTDLDFPGFELGITILL